VEKIHRDPMQKAFTLSYNSVVDHLFLCQITVVRWRFSEEVRTVQSVKFWDNLGCYFTG